MTEPVRIPADIDLPDRVLGPLTVRQVAVLSTTACVLYLVGQVVRAVVPVVAILAVAALVLGVVGLAVCVQRDGLTLDRLLWAAVRHRARGTRRIAAPEGVVPAPAWITAAATTNTTAITGGYDGSARGAARPVQPLARSVASLGHTRAGHPAFTPATGADRPGGRASDGPGLGSGLGVVDLGADGLCVIAAASTVSFALRTAPEQDALVAGFGRYLHSLTAPVQILVRAERIDLTAHIRDLRDRAPQLPDPGLERLAHDHADFLARLGAHSDLLRHQVLLVWRDPAIGTRGTDAPSPDTDHTDTDHTDHTDTDHAEAGAGTRRARRLGRSATRAAAGVTARRAAQDRLARRVTEAADLLAPIGITVTGLDAARAGAVLSAAINPGLPIAPSSVAALPGEVITTATPPALSASAPAGSSAAPAEPFGPFDDRLPRPGDELDDEAIEAGNLDAVSRRHPDAVRPVRDRQREHGPAPRRGGTGSSPERRRGQR